MFGMSLKSVAVHAVISVLAVAAAKRIAPINAFLKL
jgi:hypothetical protein